nr:MAG TPA: hypothetical protein [Crassvirales sp.]
MSMAASAFLFYAGKMYYDVPVDSILLPVMAFNPIS